MEISILETKEINIEFAALDFQLHHLLNFRGGVIMNPIGGFNQNHDGPRWEFIDRPIAATQMLPATWSNAGFGLYGKYYTQSWMFGYEAYISGGFDNTVIDNEQNKTYLPASKNNLGRFEETSNGEPLYTAKVALKNSKIAEIGLSYMGGIYNKFVDDGLVIDSKRSLNVLAIDANTTLPISQTYITAEWAWINIDVPASYTQQYGNKQHGGFVDIVQPVLRKTILGWKNAVLNIACRLEYVDWNVGVFNETKTNIGEHVWSATPAISFRPSSQTVFRINYKNYYQTDILNNPSARTAGFQIGFSSYF